MSKAFKTNVGPVRYRDMPVASVAIQADLLRDGA